MSNNPATGQSWRRQKSWRRGQRRAATHAPATANASLAVRPKRFYLLALIPLVVILALYEVAPLLMVILRSFFPEKAVGFTLVHYMNIFTKKLYRDAVLNSVVISVVSSLVGLVIAFFGAKAANDASSPLRTTFTSILNMTSNFAGVPLAFSYIILLGNTGVLVMLGRKLGFGLLADFSVYSYSGLLLTYIYFQVPLATLLLLPVFDRLKKEWREAVSLMGGGSFIYWTKVAIPVMLPSILGTLSVLFSNAVAAYATAYALLAGNFSLLPIRISEQFVGDVVQRREFGSALAVMLMLLMVAATLLNNWLLARQKRGAAGE